MRKLFAAIGNVRMTAAIAGLVMVAVIGSIATLSGAIYFKSYAQSIANTEVQQRANIRVAATILERRISGAMLNWSETGAVGAFQVYSMPPLSQSEFDTVTRVTGQDGAIFEVDPTSNDLVSKSTSIFATDGARAIGAVLDQFGPAYATVMAGEPYMGRLTLDGVDYLGALQPIEHVEGGVLGAMFVGTPIAQVEAVANGVASLILIVGCVVTLTFGAAGLVLSRLITKPIPELAGAMDRIAQGEYVTDVPYTVLGNEIGAMARAVEVFRENGLRVAQMTEAEEDRIVRQEQDRQQRMRELQAAFGAVVDAAVAGDFSQQVAVEFPDPELNALAEGINDLVSTFSRGVSEMGRVLGAMANTDLTERMHGDYQGAFATLKSDINAVADKLTEVVRQLRQTSGSLKIATAEILSGANDLSERTTRQAATIEETSATMEQLAATVMQNAQRARDASANASQVTRTAEEGGQVMQAATSGMERITHSSASISSIIGLIDEIAFQTNLLALNASVEAARAGDAGKGFAVVAVEVRRLAQSAAQASAEVKVLIEQSTDEVNSGSQLVGEAAGKLRGMLEAVRGNAGLLASIANDSRDQASAIEEVTIAVRAMDEMTQHNAALVEEINAAIEQTEAQAGELDQVVDVFRLPPQPAVARRDRVSA